MPTSRPTRAVLLTALTALTLGLVEVTDAEAVASTAAPLSPVTSPRVEVMVAVITQDEIVPAGSARKHIKLVTARSTNGSQWTGHKVLPLSFSAGYQFRPDAAGTVRYGINPSLNLLGNGATTLQFGRPDNWFAISTDGGRSFVQAPRTYVNYPQSGNPYHGSSGNGNHAITDTDTVIVSGDNCPPTWGCPAADNGWTIDDKYRVWRKFITVNRPTAGTRLDLRGMYESGKLTVDTNLTATNPRAPETRVSGAFDGSTALLSRCLDYRTIAGPGTHPGKPASAIVETISVRVRSSSSPPSALRRKLAP